MSPRWIRLLLFAGAIESVLALVVRLDDLDRLAAGDRTLGTVTAVIGLGWLIVLLVAVVGVAKQMYAARRRLVASETAIASVGSTSRDWLWESDPQLRFTYCSPRVADHLGYDAESLLGVEMPSLMPPSAAARAREVAADALATGRGWRDIELSWVHADGHLLTLQGSGDPILDDLGQVIGFRGSRRPVTHAMSMERELAAARARVTAVVREAAIETALQPIVDVNTGRLCGAEALSRFHDGRRPDIWFAEARETGLALDLDRLAFATALATLDRLPDDAYLSINATPELLLDDAWQRTLLGGEYPLERLVVEVTEHVEIHGYDDVQAALAPLRERGVRLAIDDTGAGYASFSHVLQLRPDIIKIDRSLISHIESDPARRSLVTALVLLALELDASLTAEGIETAPELAMLATLGIDCGQGYFLGRPTTDHRRWRTWAKKTWSRSASTDEPVSV